MYVSVILCKIMNVGAKIRFMNKLVIKAIYKLPKNPVLLTVGNKPESIAPVTPLENILNIKTKAKPKIPQTKNLIIIPGLEKYFFVAILLAKSSPQVAKMDVFMNPII